MNKKRVCLSLSVCSLLVSIPVLAEKSIEEVIVTAQKKSQNMQKVPIAITAYSKQAIEDQKIDDLGDISTSTPNLQVAQSLGGNTGATITMRGVSQPNPSSNVEPSSAIYFDGVYIAKNVGGLFDIAELERIEVLKGPQGSLYGKNTIGGAINLITRKPGEEFSGFLKVGAGNYQSQEYAVSIDTGKIKDKISFTFAYNKRMRDGLVKNTHPQRQVNTLGSFESDAMRIAAVYDVTDDHSIYYTFDRSIRNNTPVFGQQEYLVNDKLPKPDRSKQGASDGAGFDNSSTLGHGLHFTWEINENMTFKSITAYRQLRFDDSLNADGVPILVLHGRRHVKNDQQSQEFQLGGQANFMSYIIGLYYFSDSTEVTNPFDVNMAALPEPEFVRNFYGSDSTSYAGYGQFDFAITQALVATIGLRWTYEAKDAYAKHLDPISMIVMNNGNAIPLQTETYDVKGKDNWEHFSPSFSLSYAIKDNLNTYVRVAEGWKSGGFNGEASTKAQAETPYKEETITTYELGMKSQWLDSQIQANIAVFYNELKDMQIFSFLGAYTEAENVGKANVKGFEVETIFMITDSLTGYVNYGYIDAEYDKFIKQGVDIASQAKFPYTPKQEILVGIDYSQEFDFANLKARVDYTYTDKQNFFYALQNTKPTGSPSYSLVNARIALNDIALGNDHALSVGVWGKNLSDSEYRTNGLPFYSQGYGVNYYGEPRTLGADLTYHF